MAIQINNFKFEEQDFEKAYLKVNKITITSDDYEQYTENDKGDLDLTHITRNQIFFTFRIYCDAESRKKCVRPLTTASLIMSYTDDKALFEVVYEYIKKNLLFQYELENV